MYTPLAATLLGLGAIVTISVLDGWERWRAKKEKTAATITTAQELPSNCGHIQTGMIMQCIVSEYNSNCGELANNSISYISQQLCSFLQCGLVPRSIPSCSCK